MDRREMAFDPFRGSFDERTMSGTLCNSDIVVKCHYEVCGLCNGTGSHVNPSIDSHGISTEEFYDDPDFADDYFGGVYDVPCAECGGSRVVPVPNEDDPERATYEDVVRWHYEYLAECEAERRVGA